MRSQNTAGMTIVMTAILLASLAVPVFAETIQARVVDVNQQNNSLTIQPLQPVQGNPPTISGPVSRDFFQKVPDVQSLSDLSVGDEIVVTVNQNRQGQWDMQKLEQGPQGRAAQGPARQPGAAQQPGQAQQPGAAPNIIYGRVVRTNPDSSEVVITDYATGLERTFRVFDTNTFKNLQPGDEVQIAAQPFAGGKGAQAGGGASQQKGEPGQSMSGNPESMVQSQGGSRPAGGQNPGKENSSSGILS